MSFASPQFQLTEEEPGDGLRLITVSVTDDPTGQWNTYAIDVTNDGQPGTCPCLGDQPLLGTDANGVYITTNSYTYAAVFAGGADCSPDASGCFNGAQVYAISKAALFHGGVVSGTHFDTYNCCEFPGTGGNSQVFSLQPTLSQDGKSSTVNDGTEYVLGSTDWCAAPSACPGDQQDAIITGGLTNTVPAIRRLGPEKVPFSGFSEAPGKRLRCLSALVRARPAADRGLKAPRRAHARAPT